MGTILVLPSSDGSAFLLSTPGRLDVTGAILGVPYAYGSLSGDSLSAKAPDGVSIVLQAGEATRIARGARVVAADGTPGLVVRADGAGNAALAQNAGHGGSVLLHAPTIHREGEIRAGNGGRGGDAYGGLTATAVGGDGGSGGLVVENGILVGGASGGDGGHARAMAECQVCGRGTPAFTVALCAPTEASACVLHRPTPHSDASRLGEIGRGLEEYVKDQAGGGGASCSGTNLCDVSPPDVCGWLCRDPCTAFQQACDTHLPEGLPVGPGSLPGIPDIDPPPCCRLPPVGVPEYPPFLCDLVAVSTGCGGGGLGGLGDDGTENGGIGGGGHGGSEPCDLIVVCSSILHEKILSKLAGEHEAPGAYVPFETAYGPYHAAVDGSCGPTMAATDVASCEDLTDPCKDEAWGKNGTRSDGADGESVERNCTVEGAAGDDGNDATSVALAGTYLCTSPATPGGNGGKGRSSANAYGGHGGSSVGFDVLPARAGRGGDATTSAAKGGPGGHGGNGRADTLLPCPGANGGNGGDGGDSGKAVSGNGGEAHYFLFLPPLYTYTHWCGGAGTPTTHEADGGEGGERGTPELGQDGQDGRNGQKGQELRGNDCPGSVKT